jgi:Biotin-requiring enzyme/FHA domain
MPIQIMMPALSPTMEKGKLLKWLVSEGQMVNPGDAIAEIETEKATVEVEAVDQGKVAKLLVPEGTEGVKVNTPIALLEGGTPGATLKTHVRPRVETAKITTAASPVRTEPRNIPAPPAASPPTAETAVGAVIGRSRLVGDHGSLPPLPTTSGAASQPKTQFIRGADTEADAVAGWLVVVKGPGRGGFRPIFVGMNSVGRDPSQRISLSFGDDMISREEHAFIAYDEESRRFYLQHGGKANLVRLGGKPVLSPTELEAYDLIRIGKTTLRFIPLCGPDFAWTDDIGDA